jgi:hypothetical protein
MIKCFRIRFPSVPGLSPGHTFCTWLCLDTETADVSVREAADEYNHDRNDAPSYALWHAAADLPN